MAAAATRAGGAGAGQARDGRVRGAAARRGPPPAAAGARVRARRQPRPGRRAAPVRLLSPLAAEHLHRQAHARRDGPGPGRGPAPPRRARKGIRMKAAALLLVLAAPAAAEVTYGTFRSPSLDREVAYAVDLPPSYKQGGSRVYPVLYVLHGLFESHEFWERRGLAAILAELRDKGALPEFLVVAVDGDNSFFVNGPAGRYEDLASRDIVEHVEATYRVARDRSARMLLGVSMGGYAALRIALKHPERFGAVATHSAMLLQKI